MSEQNGQFTPSADPILGGQRTFVKLTTTNATYNAGTTEFRFDMTVQNLIEQPLGTLDGVTLDAGGVQVFFSSGPTVTSGAGLIEVVPDGTATFTAPSQPFYRYSQPFTLHRDPARRKRAGFVFAASLRETLT